MLAGMATPEHELSLDVIHKLLEEQLGLDLTRTEVLSVLQTMVKGMWRHQAQSFHFRVQQARTTSEEDT